MKKGLTHICLILDRSGSMSGIKEDVIGGVNNFLKEQREAPGECTLTLVQFDDQNPYEIIHDGPVKDAKDLRDNYQPRGLTPLYDAMGRGIVNTGIKLAAMPDSERPERVVFVTMTDGLENASKEYGSAKIQAMTSEQNQKYNWQFVYLGANQDAIKAGFSIGVNMPRAANYAPTNFQGAIKTSSNKLKEYRTSGLASALDFSDDERRQMG